MSSLACLRNSFFQEEPNGSCNPLNCNIETKVLLNTPTVGPETFPESLRITESQQFESRNGHCSKHPIPWSLILLVILVSSILLLASFHNFSREMLTLVV